MMQNYYGQWANWWVAKYNALPENEKGNAGDIAQFETWMSMNSDAVSPMYDAQQELADAATALGADYDNNLVMYPPT